MALQSAVNPLLGAEFISEPSFFAGIVGMVIHLDYDGFNGGRTPYLHSVLAGLLFSLASFAFILLTGETGLLDIRTTLPFSTVIPAGFLSHLLVDAFTNEGVYLAPDTTCVRKWFQREPNPDDSWVHWSKFSLSSNRKNDDPILNLIVSSASLGVLIALLALTPS